MVEIQDYGVCLSTINAWMMGQIHDQMLDKLISKSVSYVSLFGDVVVSIASIMIYFVLTLAHLAYRLSLSCSFIPEVKTRLVFLSNALPASLSRHSTTLACCEI